MLLASCLSTAQLLRPPVPPRNSPCAQGNFQVSCVQVSLYLWQVGSGPRVQAWGDLMPRTWCCLLSRCLMYVCVREREYEKGIHHQEDVAVSHLCVPSTRGLTTYETKEGAWAESRRGGDKPTSIVRDVRISNCSEEQMEMVRSRLDLKDAYYR